LFDDHSIEIAFASTMALRPTSLAGAFLLVEAALAFAARTRWLVLAVLALEALH
jgi:hypothetical protein